MNRVVVSIFILFNLALGLYLWRYFRLLKEINDIDGLVARERKHPTKFVPSDEWQPVARDQPLPPGLHVRINMQTGEREAKLLSSEKSDKDAEKELAIVPYDEAQHVETKNQKIQLLQEALKYIPNEDLMQPDEDYANRAAKKFRSYEELKKEMAKANLTIKTDMEILNELMRRIDKLLDNKNSFHNSQAKEDLANALEDLEFMVRQVDNAEKFTELNGIAIVIAPLLDVNSTDLQTRAAKVLAAAAQNNAKVKIAALKAGVVPSLLRNIAVEKDNYAVRSSSISALSCLVRNFPLAEVKLIDEGGLSVLLSLFDENSANLQNLQLKVVTFFNDLLLERDDAELTIQEEKLLHNVTDKIVIEEMKTMVEKLKQYNSVGLRTKLVERGWCPKLSKMFADIPAGDLSKQNINKDVVDKVINAMATVSDQCYAQFKRNTELMSVLKNLYIYYQQLAQGDDVDVFGDVFKRIDELCTKFGIK